MNYDVNYKNQRHYNTGKAPLHQGIFWTWLIRLLSRIAAASIAAYIVMSFIEIVPLAWSGTQESRHLLHLIFHTYGLLFWLQIILPLLAMI